MAGKDKIFLLDAMALIYRAHFAMIRNPIRNSKGVNTSAVFGFMNTLLEVLEKERPTHLAVVFDPPKGSFRKVEFEAYKAQRQEVPEDISQSIPVIKELMGAMRIPCMEVPSYEADDVIGTLAKKAVKDQYEVYMMTPDKDFGQLVDDHIYIYKPSYMRKPKEILGVDEVKKKWGIERVEQVIDILGLMGDASDNIPGVPNIGPKTAEKLIAEYGSIENILKHTDELKGRVKENMETYSDQALQSKRLATIITDVPIEFEDEKLVMEEPDREKLKGLFAELEFRTIAKRVLGQDFTAAQAKGPAPDLFTQTPEDAQHEGPLKTLKDMDCSYAIADDEEKISNLVEELQSVKEFAFDTETSALDAYNSALVGMSFSMQRGQGYYVPVPKAEDEARKLLEPFRKAFANPRIRKIGQNIKYDMAVLQRYGIEFRGELFDTTVAHYLLEPDLRHNMDQLSQTYLGYAPIPIQDLIGKGRKRKSMADIPPAEVVDYACEDADVTLQLKNVFEPKLEEMQVDKLFREVEMPLIPVLLEMEQHGMRIDQGALAEFSKEMEQTLARLEGEIQELAGMEFNLNSPKQLGEVLFDHLKLDPKAKRTSKSKQYRTSEDVLLKLAPKHEIAGKIVEYRQLQKLKGTYVDALPQLVSERTGRIHTSFNQAVAATGRLSSTNPNLQNIPIRTEQGREIRKAFIPDNGNTLLSADYSQIELRLVAEISGDEGMLGAFRDKLDIHSATAAKIYDVKLDEVTSEMRRNAKTVNFGIIYGISAFGLSERLEISRSEASDLIEEYFEKYPQIKKYMDDQIHLAREKGYVLTLMGRRRYLRDILSRNHTVRSYAERNAINAPIQGTAADMIKVAMINIGKELHAQKLQSRMILQVHDELVFDAIPDEVEQLRKVAIDKMKSALPDLKVPIEVEVGMGSNWLEAH